MTRAVVFDLDGTLIDSLPDVANAANKLLADVGLDALPQSQVAGFVGMGERVFLQRLIAATDLEPGQFDDLLPRFIAHYVDSTGETRLFPQVRETLAILRAAGMKLGLCTNKPGAPLQSVLSALDLHREFDAVVAGDTLPNRKPDPAPLHHAFDLMGASEGVYVGDSDVDAETAQRAGIPFAFFSEGICVQPISAIPHDVAFDDFTALPALIDGLMRPLPPRA